MGLDTDYTSWSNADLIERVAGLEAKLRAQGIDPRADNVCVETSTAPLCYQKKPKKPAANFDPSRYHYRVIALKFAYLGGNYNGFEHHANNVTPLPTIEEELWKALKKTRLIFPETKEGQRVDDVCWDGCDYSKCGRTDRGVSAFGQVIGVRVRSKRPKKAQKPAVAEENEAVDSTKGTVPREADETAFNLDDQNPTSRTNGDEDVEPEFDPIADELPYIHLINRVLPPDIRVLAWCPSPPADFSARFNCRERRYRYFFTNPAHMPLPSSLYDSTETRGPESGWLDIQAMQDAARKYEGLHDFRNFCKIDPSKQITNFDRRIFHAGIHRVSDEDGSGFGPPGLEPPALYYFEVRGSAFLWHQVRHLVAILFLIGQGFEKASVIDDLLDIKKTPAKPVYDMACDNPLVLWDCIFPDMKKISWDERNGSPEQNSAMGYEDAMRWIYIGDENGGRDHAKRSITGVEDTKFGRNGIMEDLWALWRRRKMEEILSWSLMGTVFDQGSLNLSHGAQPPEPYEGARLFDGSENRRAIGKYVPLALRKTAETPEVMNARYAARKDLGSMDRTSNGE